MWKISTTLIFDWYRLFRLISEKCRIHAFLLKKEVERSSLNKNKKKDLPPFELKTRTNAVSKFYKGE